MTIAKSVTEFNAGEIVCIDFGTGTGLQWSTVESVEVGETETKITVKMSKRFGRKIVSKVYENDKRMNGQDYDTFKRWCELNKIDFF